MENVTIPTSVYAALQDKAEKWDQLGDKIAEFYCNTDGELDEENPVNDGGLDSIGEIAAMAFGWL